jgi:Methyltransferase domain
VCIISDFADQNPNTEVVGIDLSPMQPSWVPSNLKFEIDDANLEWTWPDNHFDYIHVRALFGSIVDWSAFYREAFRCCKPGGWVEDHENSVKFDSDDGTVADESAMGQWGKVFWEGGKKFGRTFRVVEDDIQRKGMEDAGFVDIVVRDYKCPVGSWPRAEKQKEIGLCSRLTLETDIEGENEFSPRCIPAQTYSGGIRLRSLHVGSRHGLVHRGDACVHSSSATAVARSPGAFMVPTPRGVRPETGMIEISGSWEGKGGVISEGKVNGMSVSRPPILLTRHM